MSEHTWTMVAEGKCIKKRPSDNYNNQSFEKELPWEMKWTMKRKLKIARYDKYKYSNSPRIRTWIFQSSLNRFLYKWYLKQI